MKTSMRSTLNILALLALALGVLGSPQPAQATVTIYFAAPVAAGTADCSSFADACTLQTALGGAASGDEVWAKAGVYIPGALQSDTFTVPSGVSVYGGFAGTEGPSDFGMRNPAANLTVLSGDLDGNDLNKVGGVTPSASDIVNSNSYHVVFMDGTTTDVTLATVLDGFTVTAGQANGAGSNQDGGGLFCNGGGAGSVCSPTLENLVFSGNYATFGGGLMNQAISGGVSSPALTNVTFVGNQASGNAGAMFNYGYVGTSSPTLTDVTFRNNWAGGNGGGIFNYSDSGGVSSPTLTNVTFEGNSANDAGGAMYNTASAAGQVAASISNSTFFNNEASGGGAVFNFAMDPSSSTNVAFTNVTFNLNSASIDGGAMNNAAISSGSVAPVLRNVILWGDTAVSDGNEINDSGATSSVNYSIVQGGASGISGSTAFTSGTGNLASAPLLAPLKNNGGSTETMAIVTGSSAIDSGDNATCAAAPVSNRDQRGRTRPVDGNFDATATCDIGAYEYAGHLFADVPVLGKEWMEPWVEMFYYNGITTGCGVGPLIYCPENPVTRASMAVFILRAKHGADYVPPAATHTFSDMPVAGKEWMEAWVDQLYAEGITTGCGAGPIFCPEAPVTRASMAVFILRALEGSSYTPPATVHNFNDMPVTGKEWMEPWVDEFYARGITTGCGAAPLIYCPEDSVRRGSMAVFIDRAYSLYP